ncbi:MAG: ATP-binding cassette domain-containing protein, partial [Oscillospiraceae bacterium]
MSESVLKLENVTMQFGGVVAVNDLSLEINQGEIVALIGPNGAGKTTAFNAITGVYTPTNGAIYFHDEPVISNHPQGEMKKLYQGSFPDKFPHVMVKTPDQITQLGVARTFQNIRLFKNLTVFDNVLIAKHMRTKAGIFSATFRLNAQEEREMRAKTLNLLEILGLSDLQNETANNL